MCQGGCFRRERVEDDCHFLPLSVIVRKLQRHIGKPEAMEFPHVADTADNGPVAVGDEGQGSCGRHGMPCCCFPREAVRRSHILVLHHHQHIACRQFLLTSEYHVSDALVEDVGTLVGAGDNHRLVHTYLRIAGSEALDEFVAGDNGDVGKAFEVYLRQLCSFIMGDHPTDEGGVVENAGILALPEHLGQIARIDSQSVGLQHICTQGRALLLAYRWQLCLVAHKQQTAVASVIDILDEVVQQASAAEGRIACRQADH